ncbi:MAG: DUF4292 domain-containing protein [Prolixibacteraceae bacterium]|nr:DUF4292 domain-containing protein [Prolixibacteraceae bacterium]MBT6005451.1 DUF4292 domain-containing protein [Prolixibacteraceae bacterium]
MAKNRIGLRFTIIIALSIALLFSSCRTTREIATVDAKPISSGKLLKKVEQNAFDYNYFTIKRINCQFSSNETSANFKVNLKALKDEKILVSISKLNIPVGRVLLTPDSVKYVNYLERNYFIDDYSYLSDFLNIDLDFATIQSIISNNAFSYRNDPKNKDFKTFNTNIESGVYVLQSEKERKIFKMEEKDKEGKIERRLKRLDDEALILQKMYFSPASFALIKLIIDDKSNNRTMEMDFDDFVQIKNKDYPGSINMSFLSTLNKVNLKIRMSGFSTEKINSFSINIPQKYEQIRVN